MPQICANRSSLSYCALCCVALPRPHLLNKQVWAWFFFFFLWIFCSSSFCRWFCSLSAQPWRRSPLTLFFSPIRLTQLTQLHHFLWPFPGKQTSAGGWFFFWTVYFDTFMNDFWWIFPLWDMFDWHLIVGVKIQRPVGVTHNSQTHILRARVFSAWVTRTFHPVRGHWCSGHEIAGGEAWVCVCVCVRVCERKQVGNGGKAGGHKVSQLPLNENDSAYFSPSVCVWRPGSCLISLFSLFLFSFFLSPRSEKKKKRKKSAVPLNWSDSLLVALMSHCDFSPPHTYILSVPSPFSPSLNGSARTLNVKKTKQNKRTPAAETCRK